MPIQERCTKNHFEFADDYCGRCGLPFSNEYLIYPQGPKKPPMCVNCALASAGVRANAGNRPALSRRELRKRDKERKKRLKDDKGAGAPSVKTADIDWSVPEDDVEEDRTPAPVGREPEPLFDPTPDRFGEPEPVPATRAADDDTDEEVAGSLDWIERYAGESSSTVDDHLGGDRTAKKIIF